MTAHDPSRRRTIPTVCGALLLLAAAAPIAGQQPQYSEPGSQLRAEVDTADSVRDQLAQAAWKVGRLRLQPRLGLGDLQFVDNVFDRGDGEGGGSSDLRATARAGLDAFLPVGDDVVLSAFVHPTYTWWRDTESLRRFNLSLGGAVFGLFNRWTTQVVGRRTETDRPVNNELRLRTAVERDHASFDNRFRLRGPWQLFASLSTTDTSFPELDEIGDRFPQLRQLERTEDAWGVGVGYERADRFRVDVGWRVVDTEFAIDPEGRSNSGGSPFVETTLTGNRLRLDLRWSERRLDFDNPSLGDRRESTGLARTTLQVGHRTRATLYTGQGVVYSALDAGAYFTSSTTGVGISWGGGEAIGARVFAESGRDDYVGVGGFNSGRSDDVETVGLSVEIPLRRRLELVLGLSEVDIDSNFDQFDRSLTVGRSAVRLALPEFPF